MGYRTITDLSHRARGFTLQRNYYYDKNNVNGPYHNKTEAEWFAGVANEWSQPLQMDRVDWACVIKHDKDTKRNKDTGVIEPKGLHMHLVVKFKDTRSISAVMKEFCGGNPRVQNCQPVLPEMGGYGSALLYLTHHTTSSYKAQKTWYHYTEVYNFKQSYLDLLKEHAGTKAQSDKKKKEEAMEEAAIAMVESIGNREIKFKEAKRLFKKEWGAYALTQVSSIFEKANLNLYDELQEETKQASAAGTYSKRTTILTGAGRTGKSSCAKGMAGAEHGLGDVYIPSSGNSKKITTDLFDMYEMERATIMGDVDPLLYGFKGFLNMIDPSEWMGMSSRNKSKVWLSTDVYIPNDLHIGVFAAYLINQSRYSSVPRDWNGANDLLMFFGRIERWLEFGKNDVGRPVLWLRRKAEVLPEVEDIIKYSEQQKDVVGINGVTASEMCFDTLGYFEYDYTLTGKAIADEKIEMGPLLNKIYEGDVTVPGFISNFVAAAVPKDEDQQQTMDDIKDEKVPMNPNSHLDISRFS